MMVKGTALTVADPERTFVKVTDTLRLDSPVRSTRHQSHERLPTSNNTSKHKVNLTTGGGKLWRNINRRRSASLGLVKMTSSNTVDELLIDDADVVLQDPVQLTTCFQTQQRYLFLLANILVVAKQKSSANYHVKNEIRLSEVWLGDCIDQVSEVVCDRERSFVIGWPTVNMVATFASVKIKDAWLAKLQQLIAFEKSREWPQNVVIKIINTSEAFSLTKSLLVGNTDDVRNILSRCVQGMHILSTSANDFQFWVQSDKETHPYPLIGHEYPYAIQMNYMRVKQESGESVGLTDVNICSGMKFQIVRKQSRAKLSMKLSLDETRKSPKKTSKIVKLFKKSSRSVEVGNIFGRDLSDLFDNGVLSAPVMDILTHLFLHGPCTVDIFRKSAIVSKCHEAKLHLDHGDEVNFNDVHVFVSAALLKELLRCLPNCLLLCELYSKWIKISSVIRSRSATVCRIKSLVEILPSSHLIFLRYLMCILNKISQHCDYNGMTAYSLSVCISHSLLWPRSSSGAPLSQMNDAKKLNAVVERMIDSADEIFGSSCVHLFDHLVPHWHPLQNGSSDSDDTRNCSLNAVKEEEPITTVRETLTPSCSSPELLEMDPSPTCGSYDSGLATSTSLSCNDFALSTAVADFPLTDSSQDGVEQSLMISSSTPEPSLRRVEMRRRIGNVSSWFHASFEEDSLFSVNMEEKFGMLNRIYPSLSENCVLEENSVDVSKTPQHSCAMELNAGSSTDSLDCGLSLDPVGKESVSTDSGNLPCNDSLFSSVDSENKAWNKEEENVEDMGSGEVGLREEKASDSLGAASDIPVVACDLAVPGTQTLSPELTSSGYDVNSDTAVQETLLNIATAFDTLEIQKPPNKATSSVASSGKPIQLRAQSRRSDKCLLTENRRSLTTLNSSSSGSRSNLLRLRQGMTECGSDIFPKQFVERFHRTFGEAAALADLTETGKQCRKNNCNLENVTPSPFVGRYQQRAVLPGSGRPMSSLLPATTSATELLHPITPCGFGNVQHVRPARPPSYEEAMAEKGRRNSTFGSSPTFPQASSVLPPQLLQMEGPRLATVDTCMVDGAALAPTLHPTVGDENGAASPALKSNISDFVMNSTSKSVTVDVIHSTLPSVTNATRSLTTQATMSMEDSVQLVDGSDTSTNDLAVAEVNNNITDFILLKCEDPHNDTASHSLPDPNPKSNSAVKTRQQNVNSRLPCHSCRAVAPVSSEILPGSAAEANRLVKLEKETDKKGDVSAWMPKRRLEQRVRKRGRRQRSSDPSLQRHHLFRVGLGRSKSDSCEILEKKCLERTMDENKENFSASGYVLKRKLAAIKQVSKTEQPSRFPSSKEKYSTSSNLPAVTEEGTRRSGKFEKELSYSPQDLKKKRSQVKKCGREWSKLQHPGVFGKRSSSQVEAVTFSQSEDQLDDELFLESDYVQKSNSLNGECFAGDAFNDSSKTAEEHRIQVLHSLGSSLECDGRPRVFRAADIPDSDQVAVNWNVSKLKHTSSDNIDSLKQDIACSDNVDSLKQDIACSDNVDSLKHAYSDNVDSLKHVYSDNVDSLKHAYSDNVDSLKHAYSDNVDSCTDSIVNLNQMIALHDSPYFV